MGRGYGSIVSDKMLETYLALGEKNSSMSKCLTADFVSVRDKETMQTNEWAR